MPTSSPAHDLTWLYWTIAVLATVLGLFLLVVIRKGRAHPGENVFKASRLSAGNRLLPPQVIISRESVTLYQPQWIGKLEESIHLSHVASIKIETHIIFSDVYIETSGGGDPIVCHGHTKSDAEQMKRLIERFQSEYYRREAPGGKSDVKVEARSQL